MLLSALNHIWYFAASTVRSSVFLLLLLCTHDHRCDLNRGYYDFASSSFSSATSFSSSRSCSSSFSSSSSSSFSSSSSSSLLFASALSWNTNPALTFNTPRPPGNAVMSLGELTLNNTMTGAAEPQQAVAFWGGSVGNLTSQYLYLLPVANSSSSSSSSSSSTSVLSSAFLTPFVFSPPRSDECTYNSTITMVSSGTCLALICVKNDTSWSFFGLTTNEKLSWSRTFVPVPPLLFFGFGFFGGAFFGGAGAASVWTPQRIVYFFTFQFSPVPFYAVDLTQFFDVVVSSSSSSSSAGGFFPPLLSTIQFRNVTAYANSALGNAIITAASLLYMESSNSIFLFGGETNFVIPGAIFNENLLKFSLSAFSWTVENVPPPSLLPRLASASAAYMQYLVIYGGFGGVSSSNNQSAANVNDMWCYDTDLQSWTKIEFQLDVVHLQDHSSSTMSNSQLALYGMTSSVVQGEWFLFGGQGDNYVSSSSLYRVSLADVANQASFLRPHNTSIAPLSKTIISYPSVVSVSELSWDVTGAAPSPRSLAQLIVSEDNRLFVYSGTGTYLFEDMYVLDLVTRTWTNITGTPSLPPARTYGTFTWIDEHNALLYGGYPAYDSNIYMFSIPHDRNSFNFIWNVMSNNSSESPAARNAHMAASLNGLLYIVGGFGTADNLILNDTWSFSRVEGWTRLADVRNHYTYSDGMVAFNNKLFVNFYAGHVDEYDPMTNAWSPLSFAYDRLSVDENGGIAHFGSSVYIVDGDITGIGLSEFAVFDLLLRTVSHPYTPSFTPASVASRTAVENSFVCQVALPRCFLFGGQAVNGSYLNDLDILSVDIVNIDTAHGSDIGCVQSPTTPCKSLSGAIGFYSTSFLLPPLQFGLVQYTVNAINSTHASTLEAGFLGELGPGAVVINEPVLIQPSNDGPAFVLDCQGGRCLNINGASVTLKGFTVQNAGQGAVQVNQSGALTLQDMKFVNNAGHFGGAIYLQSSDLSATNSHFDFHSAYQGGVIFASSLATVQADGCTFSNNAVTAFGQDNAAYGGAIYAMSGSNIMLSNCVFVNNTATSSDAICGLGGALFSLISSVSMYECTFMNNSACNGGAIASIGVTATNITDVSSLLSSSSSLITQNSSLYSNIASSTGGAIYVSAVDVISLLESNFTANFAQLHGAAVFSDSKNSTSFNVSACIFRDNICKGAGGGIFWNPPPFAAPFVCSATLYHNASFFHSQPLISNMPLQNNNIAVYGPWIASPPICLRWNFVNKTTPILYNINDSNEANVVSDPSFAPSYLVGVVSSAVSLPPVGVDLIDAFLNLVVNYDTLTVIQANLSFVTNVSLTGSLTSASPGTAIFDHLVLSGSPGQNASITFQSTMLGRTVYTPNLCYTIQNCPVGSYIVAFQCLPCPPGTYSFSVNSPQCTVCDNNVDCTHNDFIAQQGWWAYKLPNAMGVVPCLPSLCIGGKKCAGEQRPDPSVNLLCGRCFPGFSWWNGDCVRCPPLDFSLLFLVLFVAILYVLISRYFSLTSSCEIGIFTYYTQMVSLLFRSSSSSSWLSLFNLSPAQMGVACFFNLEYYSDIVTGLLSPFLLCIVLGLCMCVHGLLINLPIPILSEWLLSQNKSRVTSDGSPISFVDSYFRAFIYLAVSGYQGITSLVLTSLYVVSVSTSTSDDNGNIIVSTVRVLYQFPAIDADSSSYRILFAFVVLLAICIVVGIPVVLLIILAVIRPISMQPRIIARYGGLYEAYSRAPFGYYNSIWVLIRRSTIVTSFQFLLSSLSYQLIVINVLFFCYCLIHNYGSPNRHSVDNIVEAISHASLVLISSLLLFNTSLTTRQSPEVPVDSAPFILAIVTISMLGIYVLVSKAVKFKAIAKEKLGNVIGKKKREAKIPSASASAVIGAANEEEKDKRSDDEPRLQTPNVLTRQGTVGRFQFIDNPIADPDNEFDRIEVSDLDVRVHATVTESPAATKPGSIQLTSARV